MGVEAKLSNKHKKQGEPKKKGFDPHKYEDIVFVYFRMNEHSEKEPEHLVNIVENELQRLEIKYTEVEPKNFGYKKHGLAHIEVNMGKPKSKVKEAETVEELDAMEEAAAANSGIAEKNIEIDTNVFEAAMTLEETLQAIPGKNEHKVHPRDKTRIMKAMKDLPGVLSVESMAGISFAKNVPQDEMQAHNKATKQTFFKQRIDRKRLDKKKKHEESLHTYRKPHEYKGRQVNDEL